MSCCLSWACCSCPVVRGTVCPLLSDSSLSLAGPASLPGGSASGLLLPETGPPGQPPPPLALGHPLALLLPKVERGLKEEVHLPAARTPDAHRGGRGGGVRRSSTSATPSSCSTQPASPLEEPRNIQYLSNPPSKSTDSKDMKPGGWRGGSDPPSSTSRPSRKHHQNFSGRNWNVL